MKVRRFFYEKEKTSHLIERFDKACEGKKSPSYDLPFNHGEIRFLKGIMVLYVNHLKNRRNDISRKGNLSLRTLKMLDEYITRCEEEANRSVFNNASPLTLLVEQAIQKEKIRGETGAEKEKDSLSRSVRPSPVVLDSIPIFDAEIRTKCLDVLKKFNDSGENERFESAVQEATKILEIRLRTLANADEGCSGTVLVDFAFAERDTKLVLSRIPAEQKGWYFFFRGVFGSIRNSTHHRFVPFQNIERPLQIWE